MSIGRYSRCQKHVHQMILHFRTTLWKVFSYGTVIRQIVDRYDVAASAAAFASQKCYDLLVAGHTSQTIQNYCPYVARWNYDLDFRAPVSTRCGISAASQGARPRHSACASPKWGLRAQLIHSMVMVRRTLAFPLKWTQYGYRTALQVHDDASSCLADQQ